MPRLGHFTGKIYPDDYDFSQCMECCLVLKDKEMNDEEFLQRKRLEYKMICIGCMGCPQSKIYRIYEDIAMEKKETM